MHSTQAYVFVQHDESSQRIFNMDAAHTMLCNIALYILMLMQNVLEAVLKGQYAIKTNNKSKNKKYKG